MSEESESRAFKILAIDGGGIRGLYSAKLLQVLEARSKTPIVDHFDMVCGTSTGGLIALALAMGFPAAEITNFYKLHGPEIFPRMLPLWGKVKQLIGRGKYSNEPLRKVLEELFGDRRVGDSKCLMCITSYSVTKARPYIFRFDHPEGNLARDNGVRCVDVALATSAAPTYFPVVKIHGNSEQLIDGGICANNPAIVGLMEALRYFVGKDKAYDRVEILSVETVGAHVGKRLETRLAKGAVHWREDLVTCFMEGQARMTDFALRQLSETGFIPLSYVRLEGRDVSPDQAALLSLDNARPEALELLETLGEAAAHTFGVKPEVNHFFTTVRTYKLPT